MGDKYTARYSRNPHYTSSNSPSFSSTLLDAVYRSIDDNTSDENIEIYHKPMRKKQNNNFNARGIEFKSEEAMANFQRACMIEKWMDKKAAINANHVSDFQTRKSRKDRGTSSSSSSDFSWGGGNLFSSSELESFSVQRPKPVRTENVAKTDERKVKNEKSSVKKKSKAMKIYDDLKKVKQPISPGGKLAGFLNSLFNNGNLKKPKTNSGDDSPSLTCSSASSFSRSCLSKTPSSAGKMSNSAKRSVRFFDEQKCLHNKTSHHYAFKNDCDYKNRNVVNEELMVHILEKNRRVEEVARDLLRSYQKKVHVFERELDDDDDAESYASSDLFELDNLSAIGMEKYSEELPVYETTRLDTNRAIVSGMVL